MKDLVESLLSDKCSYMLINVFFFIIRGKDIIVIQSHDLVSRFFHDTPDLSIYITSPIC